MGIYNFDEIVDRKNIGSIKYDIIKKNNEPDGLTPLWIADMDFKSCNEINDAIINVAERGTYGYTDYDDEYYNTVIKWLKTNHEIDVEKENLVCTPGVIVALSLGVRAFTNENDSVIIMSPVYNPFREVVKNNNRNLIESNLIIENNKYYIDFEDFENKIKSEKVKLFILCNPHNPVGRVWTSNELKRIIGICEKYNVKILSDEIHFDFVWEDNKHIPLYKISQYAKDNSCICTAPSKTFNIAGLQDSNIIIFNDELKTKYVNEYNKFGYHRISQFAQLATIAAYKYGDVWLKEVRNYIYSNILYVKKYLDDNIENIKLIDIEGTYLLWLDFRKCNLNEEELNKKLIYDAKVHLDNGLKFGTEGFMRMNVATSIKNIETALNNIKKVFE
jgi:cystathionine beta-lyase